MEYTEKLHWILDKRNESAFMHEEQEKLYKENIDFVHSLGLKCDCVGWSRLDLSDPRAPEILQKIDAFCKENDWTARGTYEREYVGESDWYRLVPDYFKENTLTAECVRTVTDDMQKISTDVIRAYHEQKPSPTTWGDKLYVPERFRDFCIREGICDLDFCWVKDVGKYQVEQYFHVYGKHLIPKVATSVALNNLKTKGFTIDRSKENKSRIAAAGGFLPKLADVIGFQSIWLPDTYAKDDMPDGGIAYMYVRSRSSWIREMTLLIHKDIARALLEQKVISASALQPVPVVERLHDGYTWFDTTSFPRPNRAFLDEMLSEYEKLKHTDRPVRKMSEKDALKLMRIAKKERKEDFQKALPKAKTAEVSESAYGAVLPYYTVANGGFLSDEYELLPYAQAVSENEAFFLALRDEELLDNKPDGIVIAKCPDGDSILLCKNGEVIRFSHEAPEIAEQWQSLAQFVAEAVTE